jgi:anti-anti-sigma factor
MPALSAQFDQLQCSPCDEAVLDLRDVSVVDCVGLNALAGLSHYIDGRGGTLVIRCSPGAIRGMLVSTGLGSRLEDPGAARAVPSALARPA